MPVIGRVESIWRYPVKSMRGERMTEAMLGPAGLPGDRAFAFHNAGAPSRFPYLTARDQPAMLLWEPLPGDGDPSVRLPSGAALAIDDPALVEVLRAGTTVTAAISLLRNESGIQDSYPVSLLSVQTVHALGAELGAVLDPRRFRANFYLDLDDTGGFAEDALTGRILRIGSHAAVAVTERDTRCKMITLDPDTAEAEPRVLRHVARAHEGRVGVYASVVAEGLVRIGDSVMVDG